MSSATPQPSETSATGRLLSVDALRGFDMFWIIGGEHIVKEWWKWGDWPYRQQVEEQLSHVAWAGFRFYDLIFPLFLFLVGVVLPFSLGRMRERGEPGSRMYVRIIRRTLLLLALGLIYNGFLHDLENPRDVRYAGVLQRIAIAYFFAALIVMNTRVWGQALLTLALLAGYWALMVFVPVPGAQPGDLSPEGNLAGYIDRNWLPGRFCCYGHGDNEGFLSTIPAIATALLGALAGHWLRGNRMPWRKVAGLTLTGLVCLAAGYAWGEYPPAPYRFPIIKNIWTSSFVLYAGGWSLLLLALFYTIIDVLGFRAWSYFFVVIGANAITIYVAGHLVNFHYTAQALFGGLAKLTNAPPPVWPTLDFAVKWLFLWFLYWHRIFLRV